MKEKQTCLQSASAQTATKRKNPLAQLIDRLYVLFDDKRCVTVFWRLQLWCLFTCL